MAIRIALIGDAKSIHIRRWARWLREHDYYVAMLSTTDIQGQDIQGELKNDYDYMLTVKIREGLLGYLSAIITVRSALDSLDIDLVHGMYLTSGGFIASMSGAKHIIVSAWGSDVYQDAKVSRIKRFLVKFALKHSDLILVDSISLLEEVNRYVQGLDTHLVTFGANMDKFRPRGVRKYDTFTFLSIRRSEPVYNPIEIVRAFEEIASGRDIRLLMQRPPRSYAELMAAINRSPFKERMGFWDERGHGEMPELYGAAHVGVSIPKWDSCSAAVIECMACGTPVIMPINGNIELVTPLHAFSPNTDSPSLAEVMAFMHDTYQMNPNRYESFRSDARAKVESWARFETGMESADKKYRALVGAKE